MAVVKGDGYCFLSSVTKALSVDCGQNVQCESLANQVLDHMYENSKYYASFHEDGSARAMLKQAEEFLLRGQYILNVADVCVAATANYLRMNLYIFENLGGKAVIIQQRSAIQKSTKGLLLRFSRKPTGSCIGNHYDAIVDIETIPFHPLVATAETTTTTSILSGTKSEPSHLHPKSKQRLPNLPPLPEPELEPEQQQQEFQIKLEPSEPKSEFVPEEGFETKVEPTVPKPEFTIPNTEDSTTLESSTHQLPLILHCPEEEFIPPPSYTQKEVGKINN